jgi:hypothetical protein
VTARPEEHADLENRLQHHPPQSEAVAELHTAVRQGCLNLGHWLLDTLPAGRHRSLALTSLQETMMWANAAVACDQVILGVRPTDRA